MRDSGLRVTSEREFFIDNLLVRIRFIIEMIWWTGLAPWEFEFPFSGSLRVTSCLKRSSPDPILLFSSLLRSSLELSDTQVYET